ncbi:hypothetical protein AC792_07745 [Arthrobacter sp. RIT-PI-e]|uniref:dihydroxyacetone kinase phosphoryl donor subunit DhaM n=1 Tax=Arthrobacter sp. RIT-PI-e TaxID=1681197 RepID=UPI0006765024|nr:dihydroxyacetone kinase phosphoryl donor subunit DhaM [Arthrobacter sp. RIT-PI-e]KNC19218.1 hypothetical protein AC792_07745 [Arthrobacter sp. RIT-PI-e]
MSVGLVIVSHSEKIAEGVVELAAQMAPDVVLVAAGGVEDGSGRSRIGTSFDRVQAGVERASGSDGVVVLTDLGSAVMTAESVLEFLDPEVRGSVRLARAALVEGAVAAAVQAQGGAGLDAVLRAAEEAVVSIRPEDLEPSGPDRGTAAPGSAAPAAEGHGGASSGTPTARGSWTLSNRTGLHARPAAVLASGLAGFDAEVTVNGVDGKSVMLLMTLGLRQGRTLTAEASGPEARAAVDFVGESVQSRFGEPD